MLKFERVEGLEDGTFSLVSRDDLRSMCAEISELRELYDGACRECQRLTDEVELLSVANEQGKAALRACLTDAILAGAE